MQLKGIVCENYKAFPRIESIEIRPLTVLIGKNSSGKSAIARLPILLARSFSDRAESPFELEFDGMDFGGSFVDLIHNRIPHGAVRVGARFQTENGDIEFSSKVQHFAEYSLLIVSEFVLKRGASERIELIWTGKDPLKDPPIYTMGKDSVLVAFRGLFPLRISEPKDSESEAQRYGRLNLGLFRDYLKIQSYLNDITYLGPFRDRPRRSYRFPGGFTRDVGISGTKAPDVLGSDFLRSRGEVLAAVGTWFSEHLGGWKLDIARQGEAFSLVLKSPYDSTVEVNVADAGTGIAQVLPIVVQRQHESIRGLRKSIEIVEQPELHLHPAAHGPLADLYVAAVNNGTSNFIAETHSENFVLRLRRHIASGTLDAKKLVIYWVNDRPGENQVRRINVDSNGEVDFWPSGVFSEDFEEVKAIREAQKESGGSNKQ